MRKHTETKLRHVKRMTDRHGKVRHYFNRAGYPKLSLPGIPFSDEYMAAYQTALGKTVKRPVNAAQTKEGTFGALLAEFYQSSHWLNDLKEITRKDQRAIYERARAEFGDKSVADLGRVGVERMLDAKAATPAAAANFHTRMAVLFDFAVKREYRDDNPFRMVKVRKVQSDGFIPWSDDEIEQFEAKYPSGTKPRLALALLLYTTQRRSDIHKMGRQNLVPDGIHVIQVKGKKGKEKVQLTIPIHPALQVELDQVPRDQMLFILTQYGKPYSANGFSQWFVDMAQAAGLYNRTPHGLRKSGAAALADAGATAPQIASFTGHKTLKEVERYTKSADQKKLAKGAMDHLTKVKTGT